VKRAYNGGLYPVMERREVEGWVEKHCGPTVRGDDWFRLVWREHEKARAVPLRIVLGEQLDVPVVVLYADLGGRTMFDMESALANNKLLSVGAVALDGERLVLRHVLALETLTAPQIERALRQLAGEATRIRAACVRDGRAELRLFAHYAL
jgi:hypothetical protein